VIGACGPSPLPVCKGHVYTLRGRVEAVSPPGGGPRLLTVHHESVDAFIDRQGKAVGMDAMTMPFPVSGRVPLAGVATGDVVAMTLCVDWQTDTEIAITSLRRLPAGTALDFRPARSSPATHADGAGTDTTAAPQH
jgi:hypothetical protein